MKRKLWLSLFVGIAGVMSITSISQDVKAATVTNGYVFKSAKTKGYSYPRALHPQSKYIGVGKTNTIYLLKKQVKVGSHVYFKLIKPISVRYNNNYEYRPRMHTISARQRYTKPKAKAFYVPKQSVRQVKLVRSLKMMAKIPYRMVTTHVNFYNHPFATVKKNRVIHHGDTYAYQQLYVTKRLTTHFGKTYYQLQSARGKSIGWLPAKALKQGAYVDQMAYLKQHMNLNQPIWVSPKNRLVKVATTSENQQMNRLIVQTGADGQATIINMAMGKPKTMRVMNTKHHLGKWAAFQGDDTGMIQSCDYNPKTKRTTLTLWTNGKIDGLPGGSTLTIDATGQIVSVKDADLHPVSF